MSTLSRGVDPAGLAAFRFFFGALITLGSARFLDAGWPEKLYGAPSMFFRFPGFAWVPPVDGDSARLCYVAFIFLGIGIATGALYRLCMAAFVVLFAWVQLSDVTNYLNHYWLVILLGALMCVVPAHAAWSVDAWLGRARRPSVPFISYAVLRFQVAVVYVFAAVAKIGSDWLVYGQPLGVWLPPRSSIPLLGPLLHEPMVALGLSWCGFLYDASIVPLLLWRRTRPLAYVLVLVFHGLTRVFFEIGMFPFIMAVATTMFFAPDWPRHVLRRLGRATTSPTLPTSTTNTTTTTLPRPLLALAAVYVVVQLALPLRFLAISDAVLWDEAGMRWSWRVMVREKSGTLSYHVTSTSPTGLRKVVQVSPHDYLVWRQVNEMGGQPDLILQLAHVVADDFRARGHVDVEVRADARITLNGRPAATFIDPAVDLSQVDDCLLCRPSFVMPAPSSTPPSPFRHISSTRTHRP
jgi:hypothetical protein